MQTASPIVLINQCLEEYLGAQTSEWAFRVFYALAAAESPAAESPLVNFSQTVSCTRLTTR